MELKGGLCDGNEQGTARKGKRDKNRRRVEELKRLAEANGTEMTDESAKAYFEMLHPQSGEISDDELDNVAGGGCYKGDGRLIVSAGHSCIEWSCKRCIAKRTHTQFGKCSVCGKLSNCNNCYWCSYEKGLWLCNNPEKKKR